MLIKNHKERRNCGFDPQAPEKKGMLKQVQHDVRVFIFAAVIGFCFSSCGDWLDVIPDGVATIDMAFNSRTQALKYLRTCYSYMPKDASGNNPALLGSDELWVYQSAHAARNGIGTAAHDILMGMQNATAPLHARWTDMFQAIRDCNTFLENVRLVPDLQAWEREQWTAEVMVLKAWYNFLLVQMYGPIPIVRESFSVDVDVITVKVLRDPVDDCFNYIVELIDDACKDEALPSAVFDPASDLGRITKPIAKALKAKILVTAASPLFNGNEQMATLKNRDGKPLFNTTPELGKWQIAMQACKEAIEICHENGIALYRFLNDDRYSDIIATDLSLRNAFTERWNSEIIWANTQSIATANVGGFIYASMPKLDPTWTSDAVCKYYCAPMKMAHLFYTRNGVPLDEDNTRNINDIHNLRTAQTDDRLYIRQGRTTVDLHFDREPRFYAWLGFDGAVWYGAGQMDDKNPLSLRYLAFKIGEIDGSDGWGNLTGYIPKKYIPVDAQLRAINSVSAISYAWPIMRLSDLYLLYAEAINEYEGTAGPNRADLFSFIDAVRTRAGLQGVRESWLLYAKTSNKFEEQRGMREIIQQERMIELSFEGQRFWDIRRWKTAPEEYTPIEGWFMQVSTNDGTESEVNQMMYTPQLLYEPKFRERDYFWPIRNSDLDVNPNLVQNIGW